MDRTFAEPLCIRRLAGIAEVSEAHFIRTFRATFGETPHRYLQRRRVERAMFLLRSTERSVTDICFDVGFNSLGTFSRTFQAIVGESPTAFRQRGRMPAVPTCFMMAWARPSSFGEARASEPRYSDCRIEGSSSLAERHPHLARLRRRSGQSSGLLRR